MKLGVAIAAKLVGGMMLICGAALSGCSKKDDGDPSGSKSSSSTDRVEDQFGKEFGEAYRADPDSTPSNVSEADTVPVSPDTEPVPIN